VENEPKDRRRRIRVTLNGEVLGRIHTVTGAPLVNISETGALLEVACVLRPGTVYALKLPLGVEPRGPGEPAEPQLTLKSRVVRCYVHGFQSRSAGEQAVTYRAAVEFVALSEEERSLLRGHLERWQQGQVGSDLAGEDA
jgi:PilZ domain